MLVLLATQRQGLVLNFCLRMFDALHEVASKCKRKALSLNSTSFELSFVSAASHWLSTWLAPYMSMTAATHMLRTSSGSLHVV